MLLSLFLIVAIAFFYTNFTTIDNFSPIITTDLNVSAIFVDLLVSSLPVLKPSFSKKERESTVLPEDLKSILVGLLL
jgi:hypothetical protein